MCQRGRMAVRPTTTPVVLAWGSHGRLRLVYHPLQQTFSPSFISLTSISPSNFQPLFYAASCDRTKKNRNRSCHKPLSKIHCHFPDSPHQRASRQDSAVPRASWRHANVADIHPSICRVKCDTRVKRSLSLSHLPFTLCLPSLRSTSHSSQPSYLHGVAKIPIDCGANTRKAGLRCMWHQYMDISTSRAC